MTCQPGCIQEYVSRWHTGISYLQSSRFLFSIKLSISQFIRGLPFAPAFNTLCANLPSHIQAAANHDYGAFVTIIETALELDTIFCSASQFSHVPRQHLLPSHVSILSPHPVPLLSTATVSTLTLPSNPSSVTTKTCSNYGHRGHTVPTCFSPGGGIWKVNGTCTGRIRIKLLQCSLLPWIKLSLYQIMRKKCHCMYQPIHILITILLPSTMFVSYLICDFVE
jgi:hypothetical protein